MKKACFESQKGLFSKSHLMHSVDCAILSHMDTYIQMTVLAIVQGLTEFLPVSSSGHLVLAKHLLGFSAASGLGVELLLHGGTLVAVLLFYWKLIAELVTGIFCGEKRAWTFAIAIVLSMIPAVIAGLTCEEQLEAMAESPLFVCGCLIFTGLVLLSTRLWGRDKENEITPLRGFLMGCAQVVALLPGVSRSGSTISMARFLGIKTSDAAAFSFLMVVPVIVGGNVLHVLKYLSSPDESAFAGLTPGLSIVGFAVSAIVGYASVAWMVRLLNRHAFWRFGFYCLALGITGVIWFSCK
jgi:undecaprenyl-diphosphatase